MADIADELRQTRGVPDRREYENTPRDREVGAARPCGSAAAHRPHRNQLTGSICWGIMPLWPCPQVRDGRTHDWHTVGNSTRGSYCCPGTPDPPPDEQGPPYAHGTPLRGEGWGDR